MKKDFKIGLALGSGGFRGAAHVGVLKSLVKNNINIDYLSGSSIGSLVAVHYALFQDVELLEKDVLKLQSHKYKYLKDFSLRGGLNNGKNILADLNKMFHGADFKDLKIPVQVAATDIISGKLVVLEKGNLAEAVMASISLPLIFKPFKFKKKLLVDGGVSLPVPDLLLKDMGADFVISVNLYNDYKYNVKKIDFISSVTRSVELILLNLSKNSINHSDFVLNPDSSYYSSKFGLSVYFNEKAFSSIIKKSQRECSLRSNEIKKLIKLKKKAI